MPATSFVPPFCPNRNCTQHRSPSGRFCHRYGTFRARRHAAPVARFRCRSCKRTFSPQTFRFDRSERVPQVDQHLLELLYSGVGLRQSARLLKLSVGGVQHKFRKIAASCADLHEALSRRLPDGRTFLLDEEESFEGVSIRPVTMPVLIERQHWFVVGTAVGRIRRLARPGTRRRQQQEREEAVHGRRPDESRQVVDAVLAGLKRRIAKVPFVMRTDEKSSYRTLLRANFGDLVVHQTTNSRAPRTVMNPLFPVNVTMAMTRDNNGRLRRRSWLVSKKRECMAAQLHIFTAYRNYVRSRFNRDRKTPAMFLELIDRPLENADVLGWRHDFGAWLSDQVRPACAA